MAGRRFGATLAVLATVAVTALRGAGGATQAAPLPPYLTPDAAHISLNDKWEGAVEVPGIRRANPPSIAAEPDQWVWAETCGTAAQKVVFRRDFDLLGPPVEAELGAFDVYVSPTPAGWRGLAAFELVVNGHSAYVWNAADGHPHGVTLSAAARQAFILGRNTLEVRATRFALPSTIARCNGTEATKIALHVEIKLRFQADLEALQRQAQPYIERVTGVPNGGVASFVVIGGIRNNGPDRAIDVTLALTFPSAGRDSGVLLVSGMPSVEALMQDVQSEHFDFCKRPATGIIYCHIDALDPYEVRSAVILVSVKVSEAGGRPRWDHEETAVGFLVDSQTGDPKTGNEGRTHRIIVCEVPGSTYAVCVNASGAQK